MVNPSLSNTPFALHGGGCPGKKTGDGTLNPILVDCMEVWVVSQQHLGDDFHLFWVIHKRDMIVLLIAGKGSLEEDMKTLKGFHLELNRH